MSENQISCPYCGELIDINIDTCPHCGEHFKEISIPLGINSLGKFITLNIITLGLYQYLWLIFNLKNINLMIVKKKDKTKLNVPIIILAIVALVMIANIVLYRILNVAEINEPLTNILLAIMTPTVIIGSIIELVLTYIITYRILRIIERYTKHTYNIDITHSELGWLLCPIFLLVPMFSPMFYTIYYIYTYKERAYNPKKITV